MVTRAEHLAWCKQRALEYVKVGDTRNAINSMLSDMGEHDETKDHAALKLMVMLNMTGGLKEAGELREFIEGFN